MKARPFQMGDVRGCNAHEEDGRRGSEGGNGRGIPVLPRKSLGERVGGRLQDGIAEF